MPENRRAPARHKNIEDINPKEDIRVRIVCTVLEKKEDSVVVDDGTGTTEVFLDQEDLGDLAEKERIRIMGRVLPTPDSFEIQGEIVQSLKDIDTELYDKVMKAV